MSLMMKIAMDAQEFKVGDRVQVVGARLASKGWKGVITQVGNSVKWKYRVSFEGREDGYYDADELRKI